MPMAFQNSEDIHSSSDIQYKNLQKTLRFTFCFVSELNKFVTAIVACGNFYPHEVGNHVN